MVESAYKFVEKSTASVKGESTSKVPFQILGVMYINRHHPDHITPAQAYACGVIKYVILYKF